MKEAVKDELLRMIDKYVQEPDLNALMKEFVAEKQAEGTKWAEITRAAHLLFGGDSPLIDRSAAITELIAVVSDIADDLQDQDNETKAWMKCPPAYALNAVLAFLVALMGEVAELFETASLSPSAATKEVSRLLALSLNGQQRDLNRSVADENEYIAMAQNKSGSLIQLACYMGYALAPATDADQIERVNIIANCAGIMSQIENDVKDLLRYDVKNDLLDKRRTLPIVYMLYYSESDFPPLKQFYDGVITREQFLSQKKGCMQFVNDSGCLEYSRIVQTLLKDRAEELFTEVCVDSPWREHFKEMTFSRKPAEQKVDEAV